MTELRSHPPGLKSGWKIAKFGDIVKNANLTERDPGGAGVERIVGLEHLDPENLHIRRWNTLGDGTSFTRKFVPGQTLFGKRRAYQRKVAFAEFEGICSGDILTFQPKDPEKLLPELLPFICQTDAFFDYALGTSAGSLSPRTSWKALQDFEFPLPPIEEQKRIVKILWAADEAHSHYESLLTVANRSFAMVRDHVLARNSNSNQIQDSVGAKPRAWRQVSVRDVVKFQGGAQPPRDTFEYSPNDHNVRLIQIRDYRTDEFHTYIPKKLARRFCTKDDVMIGRYGPPVFQILRGLEGSYNVALIKAIPDEKLLSKGYLYYFLRQEVLFRKVDHLSQRSSGQTGIDMDFLNSYPFPLPPLNEQKKLVALFDSFEERARDLRQHCTSYSLLKRRIFSELTQQATRVSSV